MQANPSAPFVHPLSLALPCPVMTIITGEWLQRRVRQRASRAIGGWKPPYRVSLRSSMRADCHMLPLARHRARFLFCVRASCEFDSAVENFPRGVSDRDMAVGRSRGKRKKRKRWQSEENQGRISTSGTQETNASSRKWTDICFFVFISRYLHLPFIVRVNCAMENGGRSRPSLGVLGAWWLTVSAGNFVIRRILIDRWITNGKSPVELIELESKRFEQQRSSWSNTKNSNSRQQSRTNTPHFWLIRLIRKSRWCIVRGRRCCATLPRLYLEWPSTSSSEKLCACYRWNATVCMSLQMHKQKHCWHWNRTVDHRV